MGFRGHQAIPGNYTLNLSFGTKSLQTYTKIVPNPMYSTTMEDYKEYDTFMTAGEATFNEMTSMVNELYKKKQSLEAIVHKLDPSSEVYNDAKALVLELDTFDKLMVQRLSKAYDDVENFVNGFTAYYAAAINQSDSPMPKINTGAKTKVAELNAKWELHKKTATELLEVKIPSMNTKLYTNGLGAIH
jgi:hypothetical protein